MKACHQAPRELHLQLEKAGSGKVRKRNGRTRGLVRSLAYGTEKKKKKAGRRGRGTVTRSGIAQTRKVVVKGKGR